MPSQRASHFPGFSTTRPLKRIGGSSETRTLSTRARAPRRAASRWTLAAILPSIQLASPRKVPTAASRTRHTQGPGAEPAHQEAIVRDARASVQPLGEGMDLDVHDLKQNDWLIRGPSVQQSVRPRLRREEAGRG